MQSAIKISSCGTHHISGNQPLYPQRFTQVLKFHDPGLAPVQDETGAYHIDISGNPAYAERYLRTFGFYEGLAAVETKSGAFHIRSDGTAAYKETYAWCGNFQEGFASVRRKNGKYLHINKDGSPLLSQDFTYVGDFKDGIAVVYNTQGLSTHITSEGQILHNKWFCQLDVYHKGFARAKDSQGWFHINLQGDPIYPERYCDLEPFYNGVAVATDLCGNTLLLNEAGQVVQYISKVRNQCAAELSGQLVGFWQSETIRLAVSSKILEHLPANIEQLEKLNIYPKDKLNRFLRALWEGGLVQPLKDKWTLTEKGNLLAPFENRHLAAAALMWPEVQNEWENLDERLKEEKTQHHFTFKEKTEDLKRIQIYQRALDGYSEADFAKIDLIIDWSQHRHVLGLGRTAITALKILLKNQPHLKATLLNQNLPINNFSIPNDLEGRLNKAWIKGGENWPSLKYDAVILPRYLHYFPDENAKSILRQLCSIAPAPFKIYIFEMLLNDSGPEGALLDLNMLAESGGQLRSLPQWEELLTATNLEIKTTKSLSPHLHLIEVNSCD